ncbi:MAG: sulfur reduction protein DsrE [Alphaproteobacteria bacterium CG_4_10_14_0_2_um_filter_63_37]|nr:MAG: sulfur reduction protein DsrE [Proteobacteria bacterium CG1_02_64_396]PJA24077.1 MAG: sulfur reduction protein DsrE [Alphaproteobacteria bacterium CG_4_10_14_0_2_um_filter_63_37]
MTDDFPEEQKVVVIVTSGPSTPHRCATPFFIASILAAMDNEVAVFLTMEGVKLAQPGVAENMAALEGGKPILQFIREAKQAGIKLYCCRPALPGYEMDADNLIEEIDEIASGGTLADLILSYDKVISF